MGACTTGPPHRSSMKRRLAPRVVPLVVVACAAVAACSSPTEESDAETGSMSSPSQEPDQPDQTDHDGDAVGVSTHEDALEQFAAMAEIEDPPEVEPIRVVTQTEWAQVRVECLTEAGFPVYLDQDGAVGMDFASPDQIPAYDRAVYVCMAQYPIDSRHSKVLTDAQLEIYYDWLLENPVACMRDRGHPVAEPPTFPTFIANYRASGELLFFADGLPPGQEAEIMSDVLEHCEIEPPLEVLFAN